MMRKNERPLLYNPIDIAILIAVGALIVLYLIKVVSYYV